MKKFESKIQGKDIIIYKLSAEPALYAHAEISSLLSGSFAELISGQGKSEHEQVAAFAKSVQKAFEISGPEKFVNFIKKSLTDGNVFLCGQRVTHLDDFEFEDIDGSILMYETFAEWLNLNFGNVKKKLESLLG